MPIKNWGFKMNDDRAATTSDCAEALKIALDLVGISDVSSIWVEPVVKGFRVEGVGINGRWAVAPIRSEVAGINVATLTGESGTVYKIVLYMKW
jgi:hypothetical protein